MAGADRKTIRRIGTLVLILALASGFSCTPKPGAPAPETSGTAFVPDSGATIRFDDVTGAGGLGAYAFEIPGKRPLTILQTIGNGAAFLDFDRDGHLDILLVGRKLALFRGDGAGKFTDATASLGAVSGHFLGCAVADLDGDTFPEIYLSGYRDGRLLHNVAAPGGARTFVDITKSAGLKPQPWGTSCAFVETRPGSGKLDLVVANYARFGDEPGIRQFCDFKDIDGKPIQGSCGPREYDPIPAAFFRNVGDTARIRFADETRVARFETTGRGLGVAAAPLDSGPPWIALANDEIAGDLLKPFDALSKTFDNVGQASGTAFDRDGNVHGGMGCDWGDFDNDGRLDFLVATFQNEPKSVYKNDDNGLFTDQSLELGVGGPTTPFVAFGALWADFDNDGFLDIALANGHVQDNIERIEPASKFLQPSQILKNAGGKRFADVSKTAGDAISRPILGRGLARGDFDNDGKPDLLAVDSQGKPILLKNATRDAGHFVGLRLIGDKNNRDAIGALVTVSAGGKQWVRHVHADGSYLSSSDIRVVFGLGTLTKLDSVAIRWPDGKTTTHDNIPVDRYSDVAR